MTPTPRRVMRHVNIRVPADLYAQLLAIRDARHISLNTLFLRGAEYVAAHPEETLAARTARPT